MPSDASTRGIDELRRYIKDFAMFKRVGELDYVEEYRGKVSVPKIYYYTY
jgi:hypothetical protein